jgi:hypothetical protein
MPHCTGFSDEKLAEDVAVRPEHFAIKCDSKNILK